MKYRLKDGEKPFSVCLGNRIYNLSSEFRSYPDIVLSMYGSKLEPEQAPKKPKSQQPPATPEGGK